MDFEVKQRNGLKTILSYLIVFNLLSALVAVIVVNIFEGNGMDIKIKEHYNSANAIINTVTYVLLIVVLLFINYKDLLSDIKGFFGKKDNFVLKILAGYGIFYIINIFCSVLLSNIETYGNFMHNVLWDGKEIITTAQNQIAIEEILAGNEFWLMFISAGILGPICEEIVFRKAFFDSCKSKELAILLSSLCFGLIHITSSFGQYDLYSTILMTIPYVASGVAFGILYIKNDCNLVVPTIVHMLSNIISIIGIISLT